MMLSLFLLTLSLCVAHVRSTTFPQICQDISASISNHSDVYYPGSVGYIQDNNHWASSSSQSSLCSVEPGTSEDVAAILSIVGTTRTPFAVKGGGHTSNPGFSSTNGVQISMVRFDEVNYDKASQTVVVGSSLIWDDVYEALEEHGVNVVGGRVSGVGVAGFTLGGGYSWLTNQYGLTADTVVNFELVKPGGDIVNVTKKSDKDLFFALKGGLNNFGIVTRFTFKAFPQGQVWGGLMTFTSDQIDKVSKATATFSSDVRDPKANIISTYNFLLGQPGIVLLMFYDGPTPPAGIFDEFLAIPYLTKNVQTRSFLDVVKAAPAGATAGSRATFNTVPLIANTATVIDAVLNETKYWGSKLSLASGLFFSYDVEPFQPNILSFNQDATAYPPTRSVSYLPLNLYFAWTLPASDDLFHDAVRQSASHLRNVAVTDGQSSVGGAAVYPNYAIHDTPLEVMYGDNVHILKRIKAAVDPDDVMGLAGGFRL